MSLHDELAKYGINNDERYTEGADYFISFDDWSKYDIGLQSALSSDIGHVTSRDQIIDPYQLVQLHMYGNDSKAQALYNADLARAKQYAERQEAAYQEWFNSPEQMAIRQRQAGLNPDLTGVDGTASASDTQSAEGSPLNGIASSDQNFSNIVGGIGSIVGSLSSVASLATSFSQLSLIPGQRDLQKGQIDLINQQLDSGKIANISAAESLFSQGISNRLSNAISAAVAANEAFDVDAWFNNDENFAGLFESYGFQDNVLYRDSFQRAKEARHKHAKSAYDATTGTLRSQKTYAERLSDPTYDSNVLIQMSYLEPLTAAKFELDKAFLKFDKDVIQMKQTYMAHLDVPGIAEGANDAAYQEKVNLYLKQCEEIIQRATSGIYSNWQLGYEKHKDDALGMAFSYMILNNSHMDWKQWFAAHAYTAGGQLVQEVVNDFGYQDTDNNTKTNEGVLGWKLGRPRK